VVEHEVGDLGPELLAGLVVDPGVLPGEDAAEPCFVCGVLEAIEGSGAAYSRPHIIRSSEARPILLLASCRPPASASKTADTLLSCRARIAAISSGLSMGTPGTYQFAAGSRSAWPPVAQSAMCATSGLQEPQPLPARVVSITPVTG
jgi:hypothetical protein